MPRRSLAALGAALCGVGSLIGGAAGEFQLEIPYGSTPKCVTEDLVEGTLVLASYSVVESEEHLKKRREAELEREKKGMQKRHHSTHKTLSESVRKAKLWRSKQSKKLSDQGNFDPEEDFEEDDEDEDDDEDDDDWPVEPAVHVKVVSPKGKALHDEDDAEEGELSFVAESTGNYVFCFTNAFEDDDDGAGPIGLILDIRTGIHARHWHAVAKKEDLAGFERELRRVEGEVGEVHRSLLEMKEREAMMRDRSELTNSRVVLFSTLSMVVMGVAGVLQVLSLRTFLKKKKVL